MKHLTTLLLLALLPFMAYAQTADITESLRMLDNSQADVMYDNEFGSFRNPDLDDPFPYVVIKVELTGDVAQAKRMLSLDLGTMYKVEARNTNKDNMILFLIRSSARSIHLLCGDGCDRQELYYGTLIMNKVYSCKVQYSAKKQEVASNDDMANMQKQIDEMKQLLQNQQNNSGQTAPAEPKKRILTKEEISRYIYGEYIVPDGVYEIGLSAFTECQNLTSVIIPEGVTIIEMFAFCNCPKLTKVTIPNTVQIISSYAFYNCVELTEIIIPEGVKEIGYWMFNSCVKLKSVTLPNSLNTIGEDAFYACRMLDTVTIPNNVTLIDRSAFAGCYSLRNVTIPASVNCIEELGFWDCKELTTVTFRSNHTTLKKDVFNACRKIKAIYVPKGSLDFYNSMLPSKLRKLIVEQ